ncbi:MAG TPA: hypothetical protein VF476_10905 [Chitinophagaceae bacterium]
MKKAIVALQIIRAVRIGMIVAIAAAFLASCKKEKTDPPSVTTTEKKLVEIRNITEPSDILKYKYDGQQRITRRESQNSFYDFQYLPGKIIITTTRKSDNTMSSKQEFLLDATGRATQTTATNAIGETTRTDYITYDAEGWLASFKSVYPDGGNTELKIVTSGGNPTEEHNYDNGVLQTVTKYSYDPNGKNYNCVSMVLLTCGIKGLYGNDSKNIAAGIKIYSSTGVLISETTVTNVLDADGYLSKLTYFSPMTGQKREFEYFYNK